MGEDKDVWWYMDPVKEMIFSAVRGKHGNYKFC